MKTLIAGTLAFLFAFAAGAAELTETIDKTFDVRPGARVVLSNVNGRISVGAWDQPRVRVVAIKKVEAAKDDLRATMNELKVELQPRDGNLFVTTHHPRTEHNGGGFFDWLLGNDIEASVTYELTVPRSMNVEVDNTNGSIVVNGVNGKHALETTDGKIELARCAGAVSATTTNGSIHAELVSVIKGQPMQFETTNGRISVTVPRDLAADVDAGTTNGSITTDLPIATTRLGRTSLRGTINGGGTSLRLRTTNGGIEIKTAS
ncbi:MAG TPA: DUF4097 family beta strand repeat-containing protein [Thermoanaerobaculia bacterium]|jgi:hypothetical protein